MALKKELIISGYIHKGSKELQLNIPDDMGNGFFTVESDSTKFGIQILHDHRQSHGIN